MCKHFSTQHSGCGHLGELHVNPWELCPDAQQRLKQLHVPSWAPAPPPQRRGTLSRTFSRKGSISTKPKPSQPSYSDVPPRVFEQARCQGHTVIEQTRVVESTGKNKMDVCKACKEAIREMSKMIDQYHKSGSVKGTKAFRDYLQDRVGTPEPGPLVGYRADGPVSPMSSWERIGGSGTLSPVSPLPPQTQGAMSPTLVSPVSPRMQDSYFAPGAWYGGQR